MEEEGVPAQQTDFERFVNQLPAWDPFAVWQDPLYHDYDFLLSALAFISTMAFVWWLIGRRFRGSHSTPAIVLFALLPSLFLGIRCYLLIGFLPYAAELNRGMTHYDLFLLNRHAGYSLQAGVVMTVALVVLGLGARLYFRWRAENQNQRLHASTAPEQME